MTAASVKRCRASSSENASAAVRAGERVFLSAGNAVAAGRNRRGLGDAAAQTHAALDRLEAGARGRRRLARQHHQAHHLHRRSRLPHGRVRGDRRAAAERASGQHRARRRRPAAAGADRPDRRRGGDPERAAPRRIRPYTFESWHGQGFAWQGSMVLATDDEFFVRGQTGARLDHYGDDWPRPHRRGRRRAGRPRADQPRDPARRGGLVASTRSARSRSTSAIAPTARRSIR